jgi:two-component system, chemotaxis family, response regulator PixG
MEQLEMSLSMSACRESTLLGSEVAQVIQRHLQQPSLSGYLRLDGGAITGLVYFQDGNLVYITHSIAPVDRLDLCLKALSDRLPDLGIDVRNHLRLTLDPNADLAASLPADFQGIVELVQNCILSIEDAQSLLATLSREALEALLMLSCQAYTFVAVEPSLNWLKSLNWLQALNFSQVLEDCTARIKGWQTLRSHIWSPYQRPYFRNQAASDLDLLVSEEDIHLGKYLMGFSFRHLASLTHQDELDIARRLYPLIQDNLVVLRAPQPPFHELPSFLGLTSAASLSAEDGSFRSAATRKKPIRETIPQINFASQTYKVACIDDNFAILQTVEQFLSAPHLSLFLIQDSVKALVEVMNISPDIILLDTTLPAMDGYEICRLLRKHSRFGLTPIIMMTGNNGLIDRAQAIMAGATDFIAKPFTQIDLSKIVFQHLPKF